MFLQLLYLFLLFTASLLLLFVRRFRLCGKSIFQLPDKRGQGLGRELDSFGLGRFVLRDDLVYLLQQDTYLFLQFRAVLLNGLTPDKGIFVGLGFYLCPVDILHIKSDKTALCQQKHNLREDVVDLVLYTVAEAVDGHEVGALLCRQPYVMDVALNHTLYLPA